MSEKLFNVGKIVNTHGIKGDLKILSQTDFPDSRFCQGSRLLLVDPDGRKTVEVEVEKSRSQKNTYVLHFKGMDDINQVEIFKGWSIKVTEAQLEDLDEDEYYYHEIIGCRVLTDEGEDVGVITEILSPGANDVWVVERPKGKPLLIPIIDEVLLHVDVEQKIVTVHLMEGLLDL